MHSPEKKSSPSYKNLKIGQKLSPLEIKEKIRKNYKEKIHSCRNLLINRFRGNVSENALRTTINCLYQNMFDCGPENTVIDEEYDILQQIREEFLEDELNWFMEEYEKSVPVVDWSVLDLNNDVICPVCEKVNLKKTNDNVSCPICQWTLNNTKSLDEIKSIIFKSVEDHNYTCSANVQFTVTTDVNDTHMYLICNSCMEMKIVL